MALQKGLVGHWTMNSEDTDNGKIRDRSAYDNHGTLNGSPTTGQSSPVGDSLNLDGSGDYVSVSYDHNDAEQITLSGWVNQNSQSGWARLADFGTNSGNYVFITPYHNGGDPTAELQVNGNSSVRAQDGSTTLGTNTWYHMACTYDGSTLILYIDGQQAATGSGSYDLRNIDFSNSYIGRSQYPDPDLDAKVDDVRVYSTALSQSEINQLYNKRTTVGGAVQGITAKVYDTQSYLNSNSHPSNKSGLDQFFDTTNTGVIFEKARVHNRPYIFFGNKSQNAGIGSVNSYPYYITTGNKDGYAWKIESSFVAPETGTYTFGIDSDDASDVLIDESMVTSYYGFHGFSGGVSNHTGTVSLTQGNQYDFAARFEEGPLGDGIAVAWQKPSDSSLSKFPLDILTPIQT